jgi:putative PIN family toxin of toxin-antitoxin system
MIDTNVLVSALLFPGPRMDRLMHKITTEHRLILSSYVVKELMNVTHRKFPDRVETVDLLLGQLPYELVYSPEKPKPGLFVISDEKDYPVLYSAITEGIDVFITGDKDFDGLDLELPEIINPAGFLEKY